MLHCNYQAAMSGDSLLNIHAGFTQVMRSVAPSLMLHE
jgi:hypothetical protein